jgi:cysteinyl-tRNA synthetase
MVLAGKVNKSLVNLLEMKGGKAMGISGMDGRLIEAVPKNEALGYVGKITKVNIAAVTDLLEKGYTGREIRYVLVNAHYRQGLNFAFTALEDARKAIERIDTCVNALEAKAQGATADENVVDFAAKALNDFTAAVNDDLNTSKAFASVFELVRAANGALENLTPSQASQVVDVFRKMDEVLGIIFFGKQEKSEIPEEVKTLLEQRAAARAAKNWGESDKLRDEIASLGWIVKDSREGQSVTKK